MILLLFATISFYTGILIRDCLESRPGLQSFPDIGEAAFGITGRRIVATMLYGELYLVAVELLILEVGNSDCASVYAVLTLLLPRKHYVQVRCSLGPGGSLHEEIASCISASCTSLTSYRVLPQGDNLSYVFPDAALSIFGVQFTANQTFVVLAAICVLPTVWLRDLSWLAYISVWGVIASTIVVTAVWWVGEVDGVGFSHPGKLILPGGFPAAVGLYGFCYSGHAVFPNIYSSMNNRKLYPWVGGII